MHDPTKHPLMRPLWHGNTLVSGVVVAVSTAFPLRSRWQFAGREVGNSGCRTEQKSLVSEKPKPSHERNPTWTCIFAGMIPVLCQIFRHGLHASIRKPCQLRTFRLEVRPMNDKPFQRRLADVAGLEKFRGVLWGLEGSHCAAVFSEQYPGQHSQRTIIMIVPITLDALCHRG